jgi:hypothetical protein
VSNLIGEAFAASQDERYTYSRHAGWSRFVPLNRGPIE